VPFSSVTATGAERRSARAGDDIIARPDVVMDRAFTLAAAPGTVWPWLVQLGKRRAGWYLPRSVERFLPPARRAAWSVDPRWQRLAVGDVVPDYGGRNETFEAAIVSPPSVLVYRSVRGRMSVSWSLTLLPIAPDAAAGARTRVHLRLRLGPVRRKWLAATGGELIDALTVAGMAAGLKERLAAGTAASSRENGGHDRDRRAAAG
jgi:hypothetical protein